MLTLLVTLVLGLFIAYFATQNSTPVSVNFFNYPLREVPLYFVIVGSLVVGLFISTILSFLNKFSSFFKLHEKDNIIKNSKQEIAELTKKVHQLELENAKYQAENGKSPIIDESM